MPFCQNCGKELNPNQAVCLKCGVAVKTEPPPTKKGNGCLTAIIVAISIPIGLIMLGAFISGFEEGRAKAKTTQTVSTQSRSATPSSKITPSDKPDIQTQFENIIATYKEQYKQAETDLQKGYSRTQRKQAIQALNMRGKAKGWVGVIKKIGANNEGKAYVSVALNRDLQLKTWNNAVSDSFDNTLIPTNSPLYNSLLSMKQGQEVKFSGNFLMSNYTNEADYYKEGSLSTAGAMLSPEFLFQFDEIVPLK